MPQSLSAVYLHLVFSTKERRPSLRDGEVRHALHAYLGSISLQIGSAPIRVGGAEDHVHVLARFGRTRSLADWVKELKRVSALWLKEQGDAWSAFQWQAGYACFSVSHSKLAQAEAYVASQEEHHRKVTFEEELRAMFVKHEMEFDEHYVWD